LAHAGWGIDACQGFRNFFGLWRYSGATSLQECLDKHKKKRSDFAKDLAEDTGIDAATAEGYVDAMHQQMEEERKKNGRAERKKQENSEKENAYLDEMEAFWRRHVGKPSTTGRRVRPAPPDYTSSRLAAYWEDDAKARRNARRPFDTAAAAAPAGEAEKPRDFVPLGLRPLTEADMERRREEVREVVARHSTFKEDGKTLKLAEEQKRFLEAAAFAACKLRAQKRILLLGGPGCGKSRTILQLQAVMEELFGRRNSVFCLALPGTAAVNISGQTIHSSLSMGIDMKENEKELSKDKLVEFAKLHCDTELYVVDEISMVGSRLMNAMDQRLRQIHSNMSEPFGGKPVVACGDFFQVAPVGDNSLYDLGGSASRPSTHRDILSYDLHELKTQQRCKDTPANATHRKVLEMLRSPTEYRQGLRLFVEAMKRAPMPGEIPWDVPAVVCTHQERDRIIAVRAPCMARELGCAVARIRHRDRQFFFVPGCPGLLNTRLDPAGSPPGLNGTPVTMMQLVYANDSTRQAEMRRLRDAEPGEIVDVRTPQGILVKHRDHKRGMPSLYAAFSGNGARDSSLFEVDNALATTVHRLQGQTVKSKLLVHWAPRPSIRLGKRSMEFFHFYVVFSRVTQASDLIFDVGPEGKWDHILNLEPDPLLHTFLDYLRRRATGERIDPPVPPPRQPRSRGSTRKPAQPPTPRSTATKGAHERVLPASAELPPPSTRRRVQTPEPPPGPGCVNLGNLCYAIAALQVFARFFQHVLNVKDGNGFDVAADSERAVRVQPMVKRACDALLDPTSTPTVRGKLVSEVASVLGFSSGLQHDTHEFLVRLFSLWPPGSLPTMYVVRNTKEFQCPQCRNSATVDLVSAVESLELRDAGNILSTSEQNVAARCRCRNCKCPVVVTPTGESVAICFLLGGTQFGRVPLHHMPGDVCACPEFRARPLCKFEGRLTTEEDTHVILEVLRCRNFERTRETTSRLAGNAPMLMVSYKRFVLTGRQYADGGGFGVNKDSSPVSLQCPGHDLVAVINHIGSTVDSGHYTATVVEEGRLVCYNDERVEPQEGTFDPTQAYVAVFKRREDMPLHLIDEAFRPVPRDRSIHVDRLDDDVGEPRADSPPPPGAAVPPEADTNVADREQAQRMYRLAQFQKEREAELHRRAVMGPSARDQEMSAERIAAANERVREAWRLRRVQAAETRAETPTESADSDGDDVRSSVSSL